MLRFSKPAETDPKTASTSDSKSTPDTQQQPSLLRSLFGKRTVTGPGKMPVIPFAKLLAQHAKKAVKVTEETVNACADNKPSKP